VDLRELRYFVYVAELKSFSKASVHLRIAQPALSRQVRKLEEELGVQLLMRTGRGLQLTEAGTMLHQRAHSLLRQVSQIGDDVRAHASKVSGTITLGVPPAAGEVLIPPVVRSCNEAYPGIRLNIVEGFSGFLYERLLNQELTLCIVHNPTPNSGLDIHPLMIEHMYLVGPGAGANGVPPADEAHASRLEDLPLILPGRPHSLRLLVENKLAERGRNLRIKQQVDGLMMIKSLVASGVGYTVLTYGSVYNEVEKGKLSATLIHDPEISWTLCIARRQEQHTARPVQAVMEIIRREAHKLIDEGVWRGAPQYLASEMA
jgi:LysR family nitrogen assimilation transcriptional regulator